MELTQQIARAEAFRRMHDRSRILILPNAYDAASALVFQHAGFKAVATTSSGVANSLGYPDGQAISRDEMIAAIAPIASALSVPLSADIEAGYAGDPRELADTTRKVIAAGAVGVNIEDSWFGGSAPLYELTAACERIRAVRAAAAEAGVPIVINARTDVFLRAVGEPTGRFEEAVRRANAYRKAGADCLFVPGVHERDLIARLAAAIDGPINVLAVGATPPVAELERLGVARVSIGGGPARAALTAVRKIAMELLERGTYEAFTKDVISHAQMNAMMTRGGSAPD
jgi:2-methylisocitrate lyase-like PEP mutase family enzyme